MDPHIDLGSTVPILLLAFQLSLALSLAVAYRAFGGHRLEGYGRLGRVIAGCGLGLAALLVTGLLAWLGHGGSISGATAPTGVPAGWWLAGWQRALPFGAITALVLGLALYDRVMALAALALAVFGAVLSLGLASWTLLPMLIPACWLIAARRLPIALPASIARFAFRYGLAALFPALPLLILGTAQLFKPLAVAPGLGLWLLALLHIPGVLALAALMRLEDTSSEPNAKARQRRASERGDVAALPVIGGEVIPRPKPDPAPPGGGTLNTNALQRSIADLPEGIAIFDVQDRLIAVNIVYFHLHADFAAELKPGASYEELTRLDVLRNGLSIGDPADGAVETAGDAATVPLVDGAAPGSSGDGDQAATGDPEATIAALLTRHRHLPWRQEVRRPNGQWLRIIESRASDGGTLRIVSDITAIKARELRLTQLAERNAVLATAIASVTSGIVICDAQQPDMPISFANAAFCRITGYGMDEVIGRNCRFLQGRDSDPTVIDRLRRAIDQKRPVQVTLRNYRKDGKTFWNDLHISPVIEVDGSVRQFVGIINDVTARMRTEESLREAKNQAELANRSKTEFLANISHELRTPLNAILGFSEVMKLGLFGPLGAEQYGGYVSDIHDSGQLLLSLINDLLDLSKIEAGRYTLMLERCTLEGLVDSATRLVRDRATIGKLKLKSRIAPDTPDLWVDRRAALQIFSNLLTNAVKFTPKGGKVSINVAPLPVLAGQPVFIAITVTDTGIGIDKADIPKVLSAFGQVDNAMSRQQQGTGLGLPIVKALVELHGGRLEIESELGQGTSVTVTLPAVADAVVQPVLL
jgi:PAS domain S-box-containing protein